MTVLYLFLGFPCFSQNRRDFEIFMWESTRCWQVIKGEFGGPLPPSCVCLSRSVPFPGSDPNRSLLMSNLNLTDLTIFFIVDDVNRHSEVLPTRTLLASFSDASLSLTETYFAGYDRPQVYRLKN